MHAKGDVLPVKTFFHALGFVAKGLFGEESIIFHF